MADYEEFLKEEFGRLNTILNGFEEILFGVSPFPRENGRFIELSPLDSFDRLVRINEVLIPKEDKEEKNRIKILGFRVGWNTNQIYLLPDGVEERIDLVTILPLDNLKELIPLVERLDLDGNEVYSISSLVVEKITSILSGIFLKKEGA
jgi:hypothetical protein